MKRLLTLLSVLAFALPAQAQETPLRLNSTVSRSLETGDVHTYTVEVRDDQFVFGHVDQKSVDVVVRIVGPDGETVREFDGPGRGKEFFRFESETAGTFLIEVSPFEEETGEYAVTLVRREGVATDPGRRVDQLMAAYATEDAPGGAIQVWQDGRTLFSRAYGMANLEHGVPFETDTPTNIGSTSKQFTAFAVLLLVEDGLLSLDDDVREHIPELPDLGQTVTIRHLLTHTSGYREIFNLLLMGGWRIDHGDWVSKDDIIETVQRQPALQNDPGSEWNYNNTAFALAAEIVARTSDMDFPDFMQERVFRPLGMNGTEVRRSREHPIPGRAEGYTPGAAGAYLMLGDLAAAHGAGGIYSTVEDLQKWASNFSDPRVGTQKMIELMTTPFVLTTGDTTSYGFGLFIDEQDGLRRFQHGGADVAHRSMLAMYPDINAGLTAQSNLATFDGTIPGAVAEAFFGDHMEDEDQAAEADSAAAYDPESFDPEIFDDYEGRFALDAAPAFVITFSRDDAQYYLQATGQPQFEIFPTSDSTFALQVVEASVTFHRDEDGRVTRMTLHQNGNQPATRVDEGGGGAWSPSPEELQAFTGRYFSSELETFYDIVVVDSSLVIQHRRMDDVELTPGARETFSGGFLAEVAFERARSGEVIGLYVGNGRSRDVRFAKLED